MAVIKAVSSKAGIGQALDYARLGAELISTSYTAIMRTSISHQSKPIRTLWSLPRVRKHGKGMRYSLPPI